MGKSIKRHTDGYVSYVAPMGTVKKDNSIVFTVSVPNAENCKLKLYDIDQQKLVNEYDMTHLEYMGNVFSVQIPQKELEGKGYLYESLGREFLDPYAKKVIGREEFGLVRQNKVCYGAIMEDFFSWKDEKKKIRTYQELIMYKLHIRGFTKSETSRVRHKGTYRGVIEKIPYLKELGVNAVFLMPCIEFNEIIGQKKLLFGVPSFTREYQQKGVYQSIMKDSETTPRINYWGYTEDASYFAPKASYASNPNRCSTEFKEMVQALHNAEIEVIMDMFFPKTVTAAFVIDCLRFWAIQYHIDGFRINVTPAIQNVVAQDPYLSEIRLIAGGWNVSDIYPKEVEPKSIMLGEYNESFLCISRKFLKSDEEQVSHFTERFRYHPEKTAVINYVTNHDGFTLADLYSYDIKHNENNGENNHDGTDYNYSWNCGIEGETKRKKVIQLRRQMMYNALSTIFLSQGTPMLVSGDEFGNSQMGNNNAYCQDNEIGWVNWNRRVLNRDLIEFTKNLIKLRNEHPIFRNPMLLRGMDYISCGKPDISYHGVKAWRPDYSNYSRTIAIMLCGDYSEKKGKTKDNSFYLIFNMHWEAHSFDLPHPDVKKEWRLIMKTTSGFLKEPVVCAQSIVIEPRSMAVLIESEKVAEVERKKK